MEQTTECRFVPGETYKSKGGRVEYRFIGVDVVSGRAVFYCITYKCYTSRELDGKYDGHSDNDILPPKRTLVRWAFVYKCSDKTKEPVMALHLTEASCRNSCDLIAQHRTLTIIKEPFKLEVDLDND